ncbi:MAG: DUF4345 family protein [Crocinitomicaceae bacterium]|nr:DUF4345 family protein [Crocinitomicaceae bacterium]
MEIFNIVVLAISGLMLFTLAGFLRLTNPIGNYWKNSGIKIENEVNMLSEVRGMSTLMLLGGLIIMLGAVLPEITLTSFIVAIMLFGGVAIGRLISFGVDGKPNKQIITGLITEVVFCSLHMFCLVNFLL